MAQLGKDLFVPNVLFTQYTQVSGDTNMFEHPGSPTLSVHVCTGHLVMPIQPAAESFWSWRQLMMRQNAKLAVAREINLDRVAATSLSLFLVAKYLVILR